VKVCNDLIFAYYDEQHGFSALYFFFFFLRMQLRPIVGQPGGVKL